ncbi:MAG: aminotransferase class V-fold PLP-dependent enzyme [Phycisphaerales bacterium JB052]
MQLDQAQQIIDAAVSPMGDGPLNEQSLIQHLHPLFSRVLARNESTNEIYLANHSLGRPLDMVSAVVQSALDGWYTQLDGVWNEWISARDRYRSQISSLMRWRDDRAIVPKTSAAQGLRAVLNALPTTRPNVVSTRCEFDSIDFVLKAYAYKQRASIHWVEPDAQDLMHPDAIIDAIDDSTDLVAVSMVCFVTGQVVEGLDRIIAKAHACEAMVLLDAYHAYGVLPIDYSTLDADFIIAGNYKYTRGGAGACFLAINPKHLSSTGGVPEHGTLFPLDTGWFAKENPFAYKRDDEPAYAAGGNAWLEATPPVLTYFQALPGLMLSNAVGIDRLRAHSLDQQRLLAEALNSQGVSPRLLDERGAYILIETDDGRSATRQLKAAGVNCDARPLARSGGWAVRLCPDLLNTNAELQEAAERIASVLSQH